MHRIGRTGRAGNEGLAISFCGKDELTYWKDIEKLTRQQIKVVKDNPFPFREYTEEEKLPNRMTAEILRNKILDKNQREQAMLKSF